MPWLNLCSGLNKKQTHQQRNNNTKLFLFCFCFFLSQRATDKIHETDTSRSVYMHMSSIPTAVVLKKMKVITKNGRRFVFQRIIFWFSIIISTLKACEWTQPLLSARGTRCLQSSSCSIKTLDLSGFKIMSSTFIELTEDEHLCWGLKFQNYRSKDPKLH